MSVERHLLLTHGPETVGVGRYIDSLVLQQVSRVPSSPVRVGVRPRDVDDGKRRHGPRVLTGSWEWEGRMGWAVYLTTLPWRGGTRGGGDVCNRTGGYRVGGGSTRSPVPTTNQTSDMSRSSSSFCKNVIFCHKIHVFNCPR